MIEDRVRELVAETLAARDAWSPAQRVDAIAELGASINMLQALQSVESVAYEEQRTVADQAAGLETSAAGRGVADEVAMARRVSRATVDYQLTFARQLVADHPQLLQACLDGKVSQAAAKAIVKECEILTPEQRADIDGELTALAMEQTPGEIKKAAARKAAAVDPQAAEKKAAVARARPRVRAIVNNDGTATLSALLPAEQAVAAWQALDHTARGMRADGDERSINQLMCDLLVERVTGQVKATDLNLEVGVVVSLSSLLGADDQPGKLTGHHGGDHGTLPAGLTRQLAESGNAWWRRLICDPTDGRLVAMDTRKRRFTGALRKFIIYRDGTSRRPYSNSPIYDIDHLTRYTDGGPTTASNGQGLAKRDHHLRDLPGWTVTGDANHTITWTTPTGHTYHSRPPPILGSGNTRPPDHDNADRGGRLWRRTPTPSTSSSTSESTDHAAPTNSRCEPNRLVQSPGHSPVQRWNARALPRSIAALTMPKIAPWIAAAISTSRSRYCDSKGFGGSSGRPGARRQTCLKAAPATSPPTTLLARLTGR